MNARSPGSTINPHYTFHYAQPSEYRFSHDSVFFARRAFEILRPRLHAGTRVLDLCAGCGIVGLDFLFHVRTELGIELARADFVEIQLEYRAPFEENVRRGGFTNCRFIESNYVTFDGGPYDVVLCNPPFFSLDAGRPPASRFRTRCHFFVDADWAALVLAIERARAAHGDALVITRNQSMLPGSIELPPVRACRLLHVPPDLAAT